jgi:hypothetical protein
MYYRILVVLRVDDNQAVARVAHSKVARVGPSPATSRPLTRSGGPAKVRFGRVMEIGVILTSSVYSTPLRPDQDASQKVTSAHSLISEWKYPNAMVAGRKTRSSG